MTYETDEEALRAFFGKVEPSSIRIAKDMQTGQSKGYAHVDFPSADKLREAIGLNGEQCQGRGIRINVAEPRTSPPLKTLRSVPEIELTNQPPTEKTTLLLQLNLPINGDELDLCLYAKHPHLVEDRPLPNLARTEIGQLQGVPNSPQLPLPPASAFVETHQAPAGCESLRQA